MRRQLEGGESSRRPRAHRAPAPHVEGEGQVLVGLRATRKNMSDCCLGKSHLQLQPDLVPHLDTGQAQLPTMDPQEHGMWLDRHHTELLWGEQSKWSGCGGGEAKTANS